MTTDFEYNKKLVSVLDNSIQISMNRLEEYGISREQIIDLTLKFEEVLEEIGNYQLMMTIITILFSARLKAAIKLIEDSANEKGITTEQLSNEIILTMIERSHEN